MNTLPRAEIGVHQWKYAHIDASGNRVHFAMSGNRSHNLEAIGTKCIGIYLNSNIMLKSTCYVNLLSKLSIIFKEWRVIVLFVL